MGANDLKLVYFLHGEEDLLVESEARRIKELALAGAGGLVDMNSHTFDGTKLDVMELMTEARTLPAFSDRRFIQVKNTEAIKASDLKELLPYLEDPSPSTCLVFTSSSKKPDMRIGFFKHLKKSDSIRSFNLLREHDIEGFIREESRKEGKMIRGEVLQMLVRMGGRRLREVQNELIKIILFTGGREEITAADVEAAGIDVRERSVFDLSEAIGARDLKTALKALASISNEPQVAVLGAVARQFRVLLNVKTFVKKGLRGNELARKAGVSPYFIEKYIRGSERFSEDELGGVFQRLKETDMALKGGSALPPHLVMNRLVMELCRAKARPARR